MVTLPSWWHSGKMITEISDMPENTYGFIYEVTHKPTDRKYLGKKVLFFERNVKIGKREAEILKEERRAKGIGGRVPAKKKVIKDIIKLIKQEKQFEFERRILTFVPNKKLLTYYECKYLFIKEVLESDNNYINDNILGKFYKKDFNETK